MDKVELLEVVKVTEEVESAYNIIEESTPKKRRSKGEDEEDKPKKPRSAYLLYYFDVHQIMQVGTPHLPQSVVNKRISESWKRLTVAEKSHYLERAKLEKEGIVTSSQYSCKHTPGFRKILPRGTCFLLPKGSSSDHQPEGSQSLVSINSLDVSTNAGLPSFSLSQESQFSSLGFTGEVEVSEQHIGADNLAEDKEPMSPSVIIEENPDSFFPKTTSIDVGFSQENSFVIKEETAKIGSSCFNGTVVQQTIVPNQNLLETNSVGGVGSLPPMMMISLGAKSEQSAKPSYKKSVKTYTRRGRGRCLNPDCSFVYVTRHKPPTCPECGKKLGGKWIPAEKRPKGKEATTKSPKTEITENIGSPTSQQPEQEEKPDPCKMIKSESDKERSTQELCRKKPRGSSRLTPEGSIKPPVQTRQVKDNPKVPVSPTRSCNSSLVQKRPIRPILPALYNTGGPLIQILTVPSEKGKIQGVNSIPSSVCRESFSGLKPNTLKLLGQSAPSTTQESEKSQCVSSMSNRRVNLLSVMPFTQHSVSNFDLGLSTARGRGRCKNPSCDYVYKNRHKPAICPKCGCGLMQKIPQNIKIETSLDPCQPLSSAQKDIQRQSTVQLLRMSLQITENETELQETLSLIQELNSLKIVLVQTANQEQGDGTETLVESGWPQSYESTATHCGLCTYPLYKGGQGSVAGQEDCWLLTETLMQTASLQLKICLNMQCLALHSFTDLHPGLFNIGNRLLVSIDLFLKIRENIKLGQSPPQAAGNIFDPSHPVHSLSSEESSQIQELLLTGYWAFECVTVRDYNEMICGFCGIAPKIEIAQRCTDSVLELKNIEFTWPDDSVSDEVHVDDFWLTMESEAIEQAAFPTDIPITRVDASIIAPFVPPLMRSASVINTEKDKVLSQMQHPSADPSVLVRLIHDGQLRLDKYEDHSEEELRSIMNSCKVDVAASASKADLLASLMDFYTLVHGGLPTAQKPPAHLTAGRLSKVCPHKVVCSSKYLVRGETARDHVDLLLSSRYWPPVYVSDCARSVALCTDLQYPELATQMWGQNQGCFSDPFEKPQHVSCAELQDQPCGGDFSLVAENTLVHPVTKSSLCWLVHPPGTDQETSIPEHHSMNLCKNLEPYVDQVAELVSEKKNEQIDSTREECGKESKDNLSSQTSRLIVFNNTAYYYLYNRLVDFLASRDIVGQQISTIFKACQPGEVVIRDALYRLGVAQINSEKNEEEEKTIQ